MVYGDERPCERHAEEHIFKFLLHTCDKQNLSIFAYLAGRRARADADGRHAAMREAAARPRRRMRGDPIRSRRFKAVQDLSFAGRLLLRGLRHAGDKASPVLLACL